MLNAAREYLKNGLTALPADREEKRPLVAWKQYQTSPPTLDSIELMFDNADAVCVLCGQASGGLELLDFDHGGELYEAWRLNVPQELFAKLAVETSQSGGRHVVYRCPKPSGNLKITQRKTVDGVQTLIETRGEGGLFLCSPTEGYEIKQGDLNNPPMLTVEERESLLYSAWELNEYWPEPITHSGNGLHNGGLRPGDDFNERGDVSELLKNHGWRFAGMGADGNARWRRPGKQIGISATLKDRNFYVFSTSAYPFEGDECYSPFAVYTLLEHTGNFSAATEALRNEGYGEEPKPDSGVDVSGLLSNLLKRDKSGIVQDPGRLPEHLFNVPGFVNDLAAFSMESAPYPNKVLAFCGALAMLSFLTGRKVCTPGDLRTNIYLLALASSGTGKDFPRKVNAQLMLECGLIEALGDKFASGEGLQDSLIRQPSMLFQNDEMDGVLRQITNDRDGVRESIPNVLMTLYTSASTLYTLRVKSGQQNAQIVDQPHVTLFGTATPKHFYESLSPRMLTNGFFARMMILDVGDRGKGQPAKSPRDLPEHLIEAARWWARFSPGGGGNLTSKHPRPLVVEFTEEAQGLVNEIQNKADEEYAKAHKEDDETARAAWSRAAENAQKLALLYACSKGRERPQIDADAILWATEFATHQIRRQLYMAASHVSDNPFHRECQRILNFLNSSPGGILSKRDLSRKMKIPKNDMEKIYETLAEQEKIEFCRATINVRKVSAVKIV